MTGNQPNYVIGQSEKSRAANLDNSHTLTHTHTHTHTHLHTHSHTHTRTHARTHTHAHNINEKTKRQ